MGTFDFSLLGLVDVLLVVCDNSLGECLSDGVDLGNVTSSSDSDSDIEMLESLEAEEQDGLEYLSSEGLRLKQLDRRAIDPKHSLSVPNRGDCDRVLLPSEALSELILGLRHMAIISLINI